MRGLREIVSGAIGFNEARGDSLVVRAMKFSTAFADAMAAEMRQERVMRYAFGSIAAVVMLGLLTALILWRLRKRRALIAIMEATKEGLKVPHHSGDADVAGPVGLPGRACRDRGAAEGLRQEQPRRGRKPGQRVAGFRRVKESLECLSQTAPRRAAFPAERRSRSLWFPWATRSSIDGALAAGPLALKALEGGARVLFNGEGLVEGTIVIGVSGAALRERDDLARRMIDVHRRALAYAKEHPEETVKIVGEETGLSTEQVLEMEKLYDFDPTVRSEDLAELERTMRFLVDEGLATRSVDPASLLVR